MQVLSRYDIRREIGRGGMGVVYEAFDTRLRRVVALKVLSNTALDPGRRARFEQEARAASALNHPHIVTVHDIDSAGEDRYIVMEYVDGQPLNARMAAGPLPVDAALGYAEQIAAALAAAHAAGIVHRDLKPANVMLTQGDRVKVVDFGLSKLMLQDTPPEAKTATHPGPITEPGLVSGTAGYMSPEQASGERVDGRTDVFAFGAVLYEMLAGRPAFAGQSFWSTVRDVLQHEPLPLARIRGDVPSAVQRLVERCLAKDPARRYASGTELHTAILALTRADAGTSASRRGRLIRTAALAVLIGARRPRVSLVFGAAEGRGAARDRPRSRQR
jgi:serine/threonine protein kinase